MTKEKIFELKEIHLKLLKRMFVGWQDCEFGAPEINPKRPYGNSDVIGDIREILGDKSPECPHCGETIESTGKKGNSYYQKIHEEMKIAIQIIFLTQKFELGMYEKTDEYDSLSWVKSKEE